MKCLMGILVVVFALLVQINAAAQTRFIVQAPANQRLPLLWRYCADNLISDWDSAASHQFLNAVVTTADSLGDEKLKSYALYFKKCYRLHFSENYKQYFPADDYEAIVKQVARTQAWARENNYPDLVAACEHVTGNVYYLAARYGQAFEHLLKAQKAFQNMGYENVPNAAKYLFELGLRYYQFEDYNKALAFFLAATRYPFYMPRMQINTLNTIGLIYTRQKNWPQAKVYYRKTMAQAAANQDTVWVAISLGNLGQAFLTQGQPDSALIYLRRSYKITSNIKNRAPEDAAYSSVAMARIFLQQQQPDSARHYLQAGQQLAREYIRDSTGILEYRARLFLVLIKLNQAVGNYRTALQFSDSLHTIKDSLRHLLDARILSRAVSKVEVERYQAELALLESKKDLNQLRFYVLVGWVLALLVTAGLLFQRFRRRKKAQIEQTQKELQHAQALLEAYLTALKEKTALVDSLTAELNLLPADNNSDKANVAVKIELLLSSTILTEEDWQHFRRLFEQVYPGFIFRLKEKFPDLSPAETRLLILTKLHLSTRDMAHTLGISIDGIRKARYRLRKKFNLEEEEALDILILKL